MLLELYLATTAISMSVTALAARAGKNYIERKGYKFVKEEKSAAERIVTYLSPLVINSIPVYNIVNSIVVLIKGDKLYDEIGEKLAKEGKIYIPNKEEKKKEQVVKSQSLERKKSNTNNSQKIRTEKKYEDMSLEEKREYLEKQKAKIIREEAAIKAKQQGPVLKKTINTSKK